MSTQISQIDLQILKKKVYQAARDGRAISIFAMLWNLDRESIVKEVLSNLTEENGQITTPLIIAARNGEEKVVQVLLSNFEANIEQTGTVRFDGYAIEGATPLWCSAGAGHYNIIKMLIEHGADVNHSTVTNSTPLRAACFDGRLDIVKYLLEHGADLSIANKFKNTCLMIASYKGHKSVVEVLLEKGADADARAHCGATALHFSAECGHVDIVKVLMEKGASILKNDKDMTPLLVAAECVQAEVVEYLISSDICSKVDKINALELLGASFANDKEQYDIENAYKYMRRGICERFKNPENIVRKNLDDPVPAYNNQVECKTLQEIDAIKINHSALHMEGLAIRERILGKDNPEVPHPVIFRGAVFADGARFDRCIELWLHAMQLRQNKYRSVSKDLLRFAQVFSQMVHLGVNPEFKSVREVFVRGTAELIYDVRRREESPSDYDNLQEVYEENIHTLLYLIVIILKLKIPDTEQEDFYRCVYRFLQQKPELRNGYTLLHMVTDGATIVDDFHVNDIVTFPNGPLCKLLIDCGANVNAQDKLGNTPLHIIVQYNNPISDFENLHLSMISLIKAKAHLDICNRDHKTAMDASVTGVAEVIIKTNSSISLKCLASKVIKEHNIPFKGLIPMGLEDFIEWH
ncbi:protein fem-1 homolog B-like [Ruditapes philippinarum]|uniref:protein fem-1 homolog B-like n=1 Tax=Ruditapes philippinarum TaxID=129788 RepID=UPI00295A61D6|nr:protein fem-1 homolog B-like [Ruditapes philippinarum]